MVSVRHGPISQCCHDLNGNKVIDKQDMFMSDFC